MDCVWSEWQDTDCSVTCGVGEKIRRRYVRIPADLKAGGTCNDSFQKTVRCDTLIPCKAYGTQLIFFYKFPCFRY